MGLLFVHWSCLGEIRRIASARPVWAYNPSETAGGAGMAKTKQFTISIDNHPGAVAEIARTLGTAKVNILSLLGTSQGTGGRVRSEERRVGKAWRCGRIQ